MTSFIAAGGSGRSTSFIPAVPAAWFVTTMAFIVHLPVCGRSSSSEFLCRRKAPLAVAKRCAGLSDKTGPRMTNLTVSTDHFDPSVDWPRARTKSNAIRSLGRAAFCGRSSTRVPRLRWRSNPGVHSLPNSTYIMHAFSRGPREAIQDGVHRWLGSLRPSQFAT